MRRFAQDALRLFGMALYHLRVAPLVMWLSRRQPKVLLYHACQASEDAWLDGLASNTTPDAFARHLAFFARHYRVVPLAALEQGDLPDYAAVITFDDGYRSVKDGALPLLRAHGFPATVYLIAAVMDHSALVWVNELAWFLNTHPAISVPRTVAAFGRPSALTTAALVDRVRARYDADRVQQLLRDLRAAVPSTSGPEQAHASLYLRWDDVREMARDGISFGNHTVTHPNLGQLSPEAQRAELADGRASVQAAMGACTSVAYPFGNHDEASAALARETGHRSVMLVGGINAPLDLSRVARIPVAATSDAELFAEMEIIPLVKSSIQRLLRRSPRARP